jgi:hypothetical protein
MTAFPAIEQARSVKEIVVSGEGGRGEFVEAIGEAGDVGEHGRRAAASTPHRAGCAVDLIVERGKGEARKRIRMRRQAVRAGQRTFRSRRDRLLLLSSLEQERLVMLDILYMLTSLNIQFMSTSLEAVDGAPVRIFGADPLMNDCLPLLLFPLLGREAFLVGSDEALILFVESCLALLEALPLLNGRGDIRFDTIGLLCNLSLDIVKLGRQSILVVKLLLPRLFANYSFLGLLLGNISKSIKLQGEVGSGIVSLANVLGELQSSLALTLIVASGISKAAG